jgi:hypothetical protein
MALMLISPRLETNLSIVIMDKNAAKTRYASEFEG